MKGMRNQLAKFGACVAVAGMALSGLPVDLDLAGVWQLTGEDRNGGLVRCPVVVPGGVHSALLASGRMCDVFTGANETQTLWVARRDWTVSRTFDMAADFLAAKEIVLRLEDCDTFCEVRVNGRLVGETTDRFQRYTFDVKPFLKAGRNEIAGRFASPVRKADERRAALARAYPMSNVQWAKNQALIRKPACHAGWDWGPELEVMGFCGTVKLIASEKPRVDYVYTQQDFSDDLSHCKLSVFADMSDGTTVTNRIEIDNPPLWWPNGAGEQKFYEYAIDDSGHVIDGRARTPTATQRRRIGLRKLEVLNERTLSKAGKEELSLVFRVNNRRLFMKGANWIPCDAYENRQTPERYRDLLESAKAANMNMLRVWGGGQYEKDVFYDLCDELGILLWHDMMCACAVYPGEGVVADEIAAELKHQLRRLRDHASIALWCGDNECLGAVKWFKETRADLDFYRGEWVRRSKLQDELVRRYDPTRAYWPSSPCCGPGDFGDAWKDDSKGDMHNWTVWHENKPFEAYYDYAPRFCSEFGYQSFPSMEVALTFASRDEIESRAPAFEWHQKNPGGNRRIRETMTRYFPAPKDVASELLLSQFQHAMGMKMACDGWRAQRPRCMGTLFWQLNDNWPVASWSSIEYGGKWKAVQHLARRFFAPLSVVGSPEGRIVALNDTAETVRGEAVVETWSYGGELQSSETRTVTLPPDSATPVSISPSTTNSAFLLLRLKTPAGEIVNDWHFARYRDVPLANARIDVRVEPTSSDRTFSVKISASAPAFFVWADVPGTRGEFDDNAFTLVPGRPKTIVFTAREPTSWRAFKDRLSVVSLSGLVSCKTVPGSAAKAAHDRGP